MFLVVNLYFVFGYAWWSCKGKKRHDERRDPHTTMENRFHHTVKIEVLGSISYPSRISLVFIRSNKTSCHYNQEVVKPHVLSYLTTLQQYNTRLHLSKRTMDFFNQDHVNCLPWISISPDLSPIKKYETSLVEQVVNLSDSLSLWQQQHLDMRWRLPRIRYPKRILNLLLE